MRTLITTLLIFQFMGLKAQKDQTSKFDSLLTRAQLEYTLPDSCLELDIDFFRKIPHHNAVGPKDSSYQVRYWIRPLDTWMEDYNQKSKKQKKNSMHPNALCKSMMMLAVLDASNNKSQGFNQGNYPELTKEAYNADWEASALVETGYPQVGFKYCYIWCLHKDDVADVYIYVLTNDKNAIPQVLERVAPTIKFKE